MIYCKELDQQFTDKEAMFSALKANEDRIITLKKEAIFKSVEKHTPRLTFLDETKVTSDVAEKAGFKVEEGYIYPVISTTNYLDSHWDVHFDGCFKRTVKEQQGNVYYALDHELKFNSIVAWQKDVEMFIADIPWDWVGKSYDGTTQALVFKIKKDAIRLPEVLTAIENKASEFENSIRMRYTKVKFAINSKNKDYAVNKQYYDANIDKIANRKEIEDLDYFWGVEELAIYKEGSLVVAGGSNDATSIITENKQQVIEDAGESSKSDDTAKRELTKSIIYQML